MGQAFLDDAQRMFACFDQPDLKAPFAVSVRAPEGWTVVLNGRATQDGDVWSGTTPRISTYLFHVSAGPWHGVRRRLGDGTGDVELGLWCRASLAAHLDAEADQLFEVTGQSFAHQQALFGRPYPFGDTYDQLFVPEFNHGAMENPGAVTFTEDFLPRGRTTDAFRRKRSMVVAHEMAHMWFGDLVTMRWWDDLWLNESFAELMGFWTVDAATRFEGAWLEFCTARKAWGYRADAAPTTHPVAGEVADNRSALLNFDGISYAKGASVLRQLSVLLGPDVFFAGVRRYLRAHAWGNTSFADLLAALEVEAGRDLGEWTQAWLQTTGTSLLRPVVEQTARSRSCRRGRSCASTAPPWGGTRCRTDGWCGRSRCRSTSRARAPRPGPPRPTCCCSTTATSPSPAPASTSARSRPCRSTSAPSTTRWPARCAPRRSGTRCATASCRPRPTCGRCAGRSPPRPTRACSRRWPARRGPRPVVHARPRPRAAAARRPGGPAGARCPGRRRARQRPAAGARAGLGARRGRRRRAARRCSTAGCRASRSTPTCAGTCCAGWPPSAT